MTSRRVFLILLSRLVNETEHSETKAKTETRECETKTETETNVSNDAVDVQTGVVLCLLVKMIY